MVVIDGTDYGSILYKGVVYQLGPNGPIDDKAREILEWGSEDRCLVCDQYFAIPGGFCGTDLCASCCTGEANTLDDLGVTW